MVPKSLHDFYEQLQNILQPIEENVNERRKKGQMVWDAGKSWGAENKVGKKQYFPKDEDDSQEKANQYANPGGKIETGDSSEKDEDNKEKGKYAMKPDGKPMDLKSKTEVQEHAPKHIENAKKEIDDLLNKDPLTKEDKEKARKIAKQLIFYINHYAY